MDHWQEDNDVAHRLHLAHPHEHDYEHSSGDEHPGVVLADQRTPALFFCHRQRTPPDTGRARRLLTQGGRAVRTSCYQDCTTRIRAGQDVCGQSRHRNRTAGRTVRYQYAADTGT